jgi:hypothetical protein
MAQDPLSIASPILGESSFDPVQFSEQRRSEYLIEETKKRENIAKQLEGISKPTKWEDNKFKKIVSEGEELYKQGIYDTAEGYDLTDFRNSKNRDKSFEYRAKMERYKEKVQDYQNISNYVDVAEKTLVKELAENNSTIDIEKTKQNINAVRNANTLEEAKQVLSEKGYNLLESKFVPKDISGYVASNIGKFITPKEGQSINIDKESGLITTTSWEQVTAGQAKKALQSLYVGNEDFKKSVKYYRNQDVLDDKNQSDLEWLYENYGNTQLKNQIEKETKHLTGTSEEKDFNVIDEGVTTELYTKSEPGKGRYAAEGSQAIGFKEKKLTVNTGSYSISKETGQPFEESKTVDFTPINTANYYVLNKNKKVNGVNYKVGTIITEADIKKGTRFQPGDYIKKRMVEGKATYVDIKSGVKTSGTGTLLIPYNEINSKMESNFKGLKETIDKLDTQKPTYSREYLISKGYSERQINEAVNSGKINIQ